MSNRGRSWSRFIIYIHLLWTSMLFPMPRTWTAWMFNISRYWLIIRINTTKSVLKEAPHLRKLFKRDLKVLWNGINPISSHRISLDLFCIFVIIDCDIKLKALSFPEACLKDCISWHVHQIAFRQFLLFLISIVLKPFLWAFFNLGQGKHDLLLALFNGRLEYFTHRVFKLNLDNALKVAHLSHELLWDLFINIVVYMMSPLPPGLLVQKLNLLLFLIQYIFSMVFALEFTVS